jgi:hypothetical protein
MRTKFDIYVFILVHINKKIVLKNVENPSLSIRTYLW